MWMASLSIVRDVFHLIMRILGESGLYGVFFVSFISNAIPFVAIPYLLYIVLYAAGFRDPTSLLLISLVSGVGAGLGKILVYFIGRGFASLSSSSRTVRNWAYLASKHKLAGFLAVLFVTLTPVPDDVVLIPMGFASYSLIFYAVGVFVGKIVQSSLAVIYGRALVSLLEERLGLPLWLSALILAAATLIIIYIIGQVDWMKAAEIYASQGLWKSLVYITASIGVAIVKPFKHLYRLLQRFIKDLK